VLTEIWNGAPSDQRLVNKYPCLIGSYQMAALSRYRLAKHRSCSHPPPRWRHFAHMRTMAAISCAPTWCSPLRIILVTLDGYPEWLKAARQTSSTCPSLTMTTPGRLRPPASIQRSCKNCWRSCRSCPLTTTAPPSLASGLCRTANLTQHSHPAPRGRSLHPGYTAAVKAQRQQEQRQAGSHPNSRLRLPRQQRS
jgi:hypothetical protein